MNADRKQAEEILQKHNGPCKYYTGMVQMIPYDVAIDAMIEYANLLRVEITEEEITAIKSEEELTRLLKRAEGAYNATGKSDIALGWRHCFDWVFFCISERKEQKTTEQDLINFLAWHESENLGCLPDGVAGRVDEYLKLTGTKKEDRQKAEIGKEIRRVIDLKNDGCHNCSVKDCRIYSSGKKCGNWHGYIQGEPFDEEIK